MKKNNAWNIKRLGDESFVPSAQRTTALTDFRNFYKCTYPSLRLSKAQWDLGSEYTICPFSLSETANEPYPI